MTQQSKGPASSTQKTEAVAPKVNQSVANPKPTTVNPSASSKSPGPAPTAQKPVQAPPQQPAGLPSSQNKVPSANQPSSKAPSTSQIKDDPKVSLSISNQNKKDDRASSSSKQPVQPIPVKKEQVPPKVMVNSKSIKDGEYSSDYDDQPVKKKSSKKKREVSSESSDYGSKKKNSRKNQSPSDDSQDDDFDKYMSKIAKYINKNDIDIYEDIDVKMTKLSGGILGIDETDFIKYFMNKRSYRIPRAACKEIARQFRAKLDKRRGSVNKLSKVTDLNKFVDWDRFVDEIENMNDLSLTMKKKSNVKRSDYKEGAKALDEIYDKIQELAMSSAGQGGLFGVFQFMDQDSSNHISQKEFKDVVKNLGLSNVTSKQIQTIFDKYDTNKDNSISYGEFQKMVEHVSADKTISDKNHWAFAIFENFRRKYGNSKKSIVQIFNVEYKHGEENCFISWDNFLDVIEDHQVVSKGHQKQLKDLLDVKIQNNRVDLKVFQTLVGIGFEPEEKGKKSKKLRDQQDKEDAWQVDRPKTRDLMYKLYKSKIDEVVLRRDLKLSATKRETVDKDNFIEYIVGSVFSEDSKTSKQLEKTVEKLSKFFKNKKYPDEIDYIQFLEIYMIFKDEFRACEIIFRTFDALMENNNIKSMDKLIEKYCKSKDKNRLTEAEANTMFTKMLMRIEDFEMELILQQFDPSGKSKYIDIEVLQNSFEEWRIEQEALKFSKKTGGKYDDDDQKDKPYPESDSEEEQDTAKLQKKFDQIMENIAKHYQEQNVDVDKMFKKFEKSPGKFNATIDGQQFLNAVMEAAPENIYINNSEKRIIEKKYSKGKWIQYDEFQSDIKSRLKLYKDIKDLNQEFKKPEQIQLLDRMKKWIKVEDNQVPIQLTIAFKIEDPNDKKFIKNTQIVSILKKHGFSFKNDSDHAVLMSMIGMSGANGSYVDVMMLLKGPAYTSKIMKFSPEQLKKGNFVETTSFKQNKFKALREPINPKNDWMGRIGQLLCSCGKDYEKKFFKLIDQNSPSAKAKPMIKYDMLTSVFRELDIDLNMKLQTDLDKYIKQIQSEDKKFPLLDFLEDCGVPAQTFGSDALKYQNALKNLSITQLDECHQYMMELRESIQKFKSTSRMNIKNFIDVFVNAKKDQDAEDMDSQTFFKVIDGFDEKLSKKMQQIETNLICYLAENYRDKISYNKLGIALNMRSKDEPLVQAGTEGLIAYEKKIRKSLSKEGDLDTADTVLDNFLNFCVKHSLNFQKLMEFSSDMQPSFTIQDFVERLEEIDFKTDFQDVLIKKLDHKKSGRSIQSKYLDDMLKKAFSKKPMSQSTANKRIRDFDPITQKILAIILKQLDDKNITTKQLYDKLDEDKDGKIDKKEFVDRMSLSIGFDPKKLNSSELGRLFDALDMNTSGSLSINELGMYIQGAKKDKETKIKNMDPETKRMLENDIEQMFVYFDINGDGSVDAGEISTTLRLIGQVKDIKECKEMILKAGGDESGIGKQKFKNLMLPIMQDQLISQEETQEDLRQIFKEADADGSGYLSIDELTIALKKTGAKVTNEDIVKLMTEIDVDQDGELDIDEFCSLMSLGGQMNFKDSKNVGTFSKIQHSRQNKALKFLQAFQVMPSNFVSSFITKRWEQDTENLPSSVFALQMDPKSMCWKDIREPDRDKMKTTDKFDGKFEPKFRPMESSLAAMIQIKEATGVPGPEALNSQNGAKKSSNDSEIVKRALRVSVEAKQGLSRNIVANAIQIPVDYSPANSDLWSFDTSESAKLMRQFLFRTTEWDGLDSKDAEGRMLFELVAYVKTGNSQEVTEMCCGWSELPLESFKSTSNIGSQKLLINGGTPIQNIEIASSDVIANRSGFKAVQAAFSGGVKSHIEISITVEKKFEKNISTHLQVMPSTCLIQTPLLYFVSGFMNYKAKKILSETSAGKFQKPSGDVVISLFPKVLDNPDVMEELVPAWQDHALAEIKEKRMEFDCDFIIEKTCDFIKRLYPVLYSVEFSNMKSIGVTKSGDGLKGNLGKKRRDIVKNALRYNQVQLKGAKPMKASNPYEDVSFEPFNINELSYDVWDSSKSKEQAFQARHMNRAKNKNKAPSPAYDNYDNVRRSRDQKNVSFA